MKKYLIIAFLMAQGFANEAVTIVEETVEGFGDSLMKLTIKDGENNNEKIFNNRIFNGSRFRK